METQVMLCAGRLPYIVVGFEKREEAEQFQEALQQRFAKFGLELHPEKTRLLEFGRFARERRRKRGLGKPKSFNFLGFTHISGESRKGRFQVERRTIAQRFRTKLAEVKAELRRRMHLPVPVQGAWLRSVVLGHYRYYGVPHNAKALQRFRKEVARLWQRSLSRRSHKGYVTWDRMERYVDKWLPVARIYHPYPDERFGGMTRGRSPVPLKKSRTRVELNSTLVILSLAVPQEPSTQSARTGLAREGENPWDTSSRKLRFERLYRAE